MTRKTKTKKVDAGTRLKRLAREYALAWEDLSWMGSGDPEDWPETRKRYREARRKLHDAIDELLLKYEGPNCG